MTADSADTHHAATVDMLAMRTAGATWAAIGDQHGITPGAAKSRVQREMKRQASRSDFTEELMQRARAEVSGGADPESVAASLSAAAQWVRGLRKP